MKSELGFRGAVALCLALVIGWPAIGAKSAIGLRLDPILRTDPQSRDPGYLCSLMLGRKSYLNLSSGPPSQLVFKPNGKVVSFEISREKFRRMQEFGYEVDGVESSAQTINVGHYILIMKKAGKVRDLPDGNSLLVSVTVSRGKAKNTVTGNWLCGG
jgi:hypothetical protein